MKYCLVNNILYKTNFFDDRSSQGIIESTTTLYRDREIHPSVKDLQSTTRLAESWKLHIFDTRVDFPVPVQSGC